MIVLDIPVPPSVNETRRVDWRGHKKLKAWREEAGKTLLINKQNKQQGISGEYEVDIIVAHNKERKDLDNVVKGILDFCVAYGFIKDDGPQYMSSLTVRFDDNLDTKTCRVIISSL